jgi:hypothetical protein
MSRRDPQTTTWPFLVILAALFALSVTAPRGWESSAREQGLGSLLVQLPGNEAPQLAPIPPAIPSLPTVLAATEPAVATSNAKLTRSYVVLPEPTPAAPEARNEPTLAPVRLKTPPAPLPEIADNRLTEPTLAGPTIAMPEVPTVPAPATIPAPTLALPSPSLPALVFPAMEAPAVVTPAVPVAVEAPAIKPAEVVELPVQAPALTAPVSVAALPKRDKEIPNLLVPTAPVHQAQPRTIVERSPWWPVPEELFEQLNELSANDVCGSWACAVRELVDELVRQESPNSAATLEIVGELKKLLAEQTAILARMPEGPVSADFRRVGFALERRLSIWKHVPEVAQHEALDVARNVDPQKLSTCLDEVVAHTGDTPAGEAWRKYLLVDSLKRLADRRAGMDVDQQRSLAERVLGRLDRSNVSEQQRHLLTNGPLAHLRSELRHWASRPIDARQMLFHLEQFEQTGLPSHARLVALHRRTLGWSSEESEQELAKEIEGHYRNANLRISLSEDFLNRFVPTREPETAPVNDVVLGHPVRGWSSTKTDIGFRLIPDPNRVRMALETRGQVFSQTVTKSGPVKVRTDADSVFLASKEVELGVQGIKVSPTQVAANTSPRLASVESGLDIVPLLGSVVHSVAEIKFEDSKEQANREARWKITKRVRERVDNELQPKVDNANEKLRQKVLAPLAGLGLEPKLIEAQTTPHRITLRMRLASDEQLAGHSARPRAPGDNLASLQVHQSLLNNICEQLRWEGRTLTLPELRKELGEKLHRKFEVPAEKEHAELAITFAPENAVRVRCDDGRVEVNLALAKLQLGHESWRDFHVRVFYKPDLSSPNGHLSRDGTVQLIGDRLGAKAQIALRGIFLKTFPAAKGVDIIPATASEHPALKDLEVRQFDIEEGWIGIALAPRRDMARKLINPLRK